MELLKEHRALIKKLVKASPKYKGNEHLLEDKCSETYKKSYLILQSVEDIDSLHAYMKKVVSSAIIDVLKNSGRIVRTTQGYSSVKEISVTGYHSEVKTIEVPNENTSAKKKRGRKKNTETTVEQEVLTEVQPSKVAVLDEIPEPIDITDDFSNQSEEIEVAEEIINKPDDNLYPNKAPVLSKDIIYIKDPRESLEEQIIRKDILENIIDLVKQIDYEKPQEMFLKLFFSRYFLQMKQKDIAQDLEISQAEVSKRLVQLSQLIKEKLY